MLKTKRKVNSRRTKGPDLNDDRRPQQALSPLGILDGDHGISTTMSEDKFEEKTPLTAYEILPFKEEIGTYFNTFSDYMSSYPFFSNGRL
jgi:hypothetical protein